MTAPTCRYCNTWPEVICCDKALCDRHYEEHCREDHPEDSVLGNERGIETVEWLAISVLILMVAFAVYPGTLQQGLTDVVTAITDALKGSVPPPKGGG